MKIPLNNFRIRLKSFLRGGSWSDPYELWPNMPSDFEIVRRCRIRQSREGNVIPISGKTEEEERLGSALEIRKTFIDFQQYLYKEITA